MEENMSSKEASSGVDNMSTEGLDSNGNCYPSDPNRHLGHCSKESINKFNGIMPHQNGTCGSQIYANGHQIWLGTVKSEKEPEITAYDRTAMELRYGASHRNFPWTNVFAKEPNFQSQPRFQGIHGGNCGNTESGIFCGFNLYAMQKKGNFLRKLLFQKMLTPSDVGRLNRIVIPKKNATTCFSEISRRMEEDAKAGMLGDALVDFLDRTMRSWKFRYCYWKSSQSYVFTRGWSRFVKENQLKVNDVVAFYLCEVQREGKILDKFFMIDPVRGEEVGDDHHILGVSQPEMLTSVVFEGSYYHNVGLRPEMGSSVFEGGSYNNHHHVELKSEVFSDNVDKRFGKQVMVDADSPSNVERQGFRLFGVQIN